MPLTKYISRKDEYVEEQRCKEQKSNSSNTDNETFIHSVNLNRNPFSSGFVHQNLIKIHIDVFLS